MLGGYAKMFDESSQHSVAPAIRPRSATSEIAGEILDRMESNGRLAMQVAVLIVVHAATTGGVAADAVNVIVTIEHGDNSALSDAADLKTYTHTVRVDDNDGNHAIVVEVPVKLLSAKRYIRPLVQVTKTGTATLSAAVAGGAFIKFPADGVPVSTYDKDGYGDAEVDTAV